MKILGRKPSLGIKRALIIASAVWMIGYYLTHKDAIDFSWTVGQSTPSMMCSDVYSPGDERLAACEAAGPESWSTRYLKELRGESADVPFDYYRRANHNFSVWYWLFGVPLALFLLAYGVQWIIAGFEADRKRS